MKKIVILLIFVVIIVAVVSYMSINYNAQKKKIDQYNYEFETYYNQEISGVDVATIINNAIYYNNKNNVTKDNKGKYLDNNENSINIDIKMLDDDNIYNMEKIYKNGTQTFIDYYSKIKFKMTKMEYHSKTNKVKYIYIEQITK